MENARRTSIVVGASRERVLVLQSGAFSPTTVRASASLILPRVLMQPGPPSTTTEGSNNGSFNLSHPKSHPAKPNILDNPVTPRAGFATVEEGGKASLCLVRRGIRPRAIIVDLMSRALNASAEKKVAWKVVASNYAFLALGALFDAGMVL